MRYFIDALGSPARPDLARRLRSRLRGALGPWHSDPPGAKHRSRSGNATPLRRRPGRLCWRRDQPHHPRRAPHRRGGREPAARDPRVFSRIHRPATGGQRILGHRPRGPCTTATCYPDRLGGAIIASHIRIADAGPVADMVHFHTVGFQLIFCHRGWVRLVYEDQGPPIRARRRRLRHPAPRNTPPRARCLGGRRGDRDRSPRRTPHQH